MYYVEAATQDQIAARVGLSRQGVQRALTLARTEALIKIRLDHPIASCMELADAVRQGYGLDFCNVATVMPGSASLRPLAVLAASTLESYLEDSRSLIIGLGTGRSLRAMVDETSHIHCPRHRLVSRVGVMSPDGAMNPFDAMIWLADKTEARSYQLPAPILAVSAEERGRIVEQRLYTRVAELARTADVSFIGIGTIDDQAPLRLEGCISQVGVRALQGMGAVGELTGWVLERDGELLEGGINERVTSVPLTRRHERPLIGVAGGLNKVDAIRAAVRGGWLSGLITDEEVARALLSG